MGLAGIRPLEPGFARVAIRPQLGDLPDLELTAHTPRGPIAFHARAGRATVALPTGCEGEFHSPGRARSASPARVSSGCKDAYSGSKMAMPCRFLFSMVT